MSWAARDFDAFSMASAGDGAAATAHAAVTPLSVVRRLTGGERGVSAAAAWTRSANVLVLVYVAALRPRRARRHAAVIDVACIACSSLESWAELCWSLLQRDNEIARGEQARG